MMSLSYEARAASRLDAQARARVQEVLARISRPSLEGQSRLERTQDLDQQSEQQNQTMNYIA